jgi:hypothetical protein
MTLPSAPQWEKRAGVRVSCAYAGPTTGDFLASNSTTLKVTPVRKIPSPGCSNSASVSPPGSAGDGSLGGKASGSSGLAMVSRASQVSRENKARTSNGRSSATSR